MEIEKESIFIPHKEKEPLKNQKVYRFEVEGNIRPKNKIPNIDKIEILGNWRTFKNQKVGSIEVEGNIRPENNIQNIDKIEILRTPKPENLIVEEKDSIFIPRKKKSL